MAIRLVLRHCRGHGKTRVDYVGTQYTYGDTKELELDPRYYYFKGWLNNRGMWDENLLIDCQMNARSGYEAMKKFLEEGKPLTSIEVFQSESAKMAAQCLLSGWNGFTIPKQIVIPTRLIDRESIK